MTSIVLVTGASGFVAKHCVAELLRRNHRVRGTVRHPARGEEVRSALGRSGKDETQLGFAIADLMHDEGWDAALEGCSHVLHVASPFPMRLPRDRQEIVVPAREGTLRVLRAAARAGVKRVVLTSSMVACVYPAGGVQAGTYTETDWTDPSRRDLSPYVAAKTLAERAAWDYVHATPNAPQLTVLNPGFVQGPALDRDLSTSQEVLRLMAVGKYPAAPKAGYAIVDVRDLAVAHAVALEHPAAAGERFLLANGFLTFRDMAQILASTLPDLARRVPKLEAPDVLLRVMSLLDPSLLAVLPDLSTPRRCDNVKARTRLQMEFRPPREAVVAAATSLRDRGVI